MFFCGFAGIRKAKDSASNVRGAPSKILCDGQNSAYRETYKNISKSSEVHYPEPLLQNISFGATVMQVQLLIEQVRTGTHSHIQGMQTAFH
jgi:hypothetical protein